jgi:hypothetical protein
MIGEGCIPGTSDDSRFTRHMTILTSDPSLSLGRRGPLAQRVEEGVFLGTLESQLMTVGASLRPGEPIVPRDRMGCLADAEFPRSDQAVSSEMTSDTSNSLKVENRIPGWIGSVSF